MDEQNVLRGRKFGEAGFSSMHWGVVWFLNVVTLGLFNVYWLHRNAGATDRLNGDNVRVRVSVVLILIAVLLNIYGCYLARSIFLNDFLFWLYANPRYLLANHLVFVILYSFSYFFALFAYVYVLFEIRNKVKAYLRELYMDFIGRDCMKNLWLVMILGTPYFQYEINRLKSSGILENSANLKETRFYDHMSVNTNALKAERSLMRKRYVWGMIGICIALFLILYFIKDPIERVLPHHYYAFYGESVYNSPFGALFVFVVMRIYSFYWILSTNKQINSLSSVVKLPYSYCVKLYVAPIALIIISIVIRYLIGEDLFKYLNMKVSSVLGLLLPFAYNAFNIMILFSLYIYFSYRDAMMDHIWTVFTPSKALQQRFSCVFICLFSFFYLQFKINRFQEEGFWDYEMKVEE